MAEDIVAVPVGNPGNAADDTGYGAVAYDYRIGKYEVTAGQYRDFLNAVDPTGANSHGLYSSDMLKNRDYGSGCQITQHVGGNYDFSGRPSGTEADWVDRPVNYVSWYDAAMYANWATSGNIHQGAYDTSAGANWGSSDAGAYTGITAHDSAEMDDMVSTYGKVYVLPTENEWYKAAYHENDGNTGNYFDYPTSSNSVPGTDMTEGTNPGNNANFYASDFLIGSPYFRTEVGEFELSDSPYGTFDQGGNVWEWNEALIGSSRNVRGGTFGASDYTMLAASIRGAKSPSSDGYLVGFRVAEIPEPATMAILMLGGIGILRKRRKQ